MHQPHAAMSKSPSKAIFLTGNKAQVMLYRNGWKDLLSSVSLFGLVVLQLLDDCSCEMWWSFRGELKLNHQTRWLVISHKQCGHLWPFSYYAVSCGGPRIERFLVKLKHLAWSAITELPNKLLSLKPFYQIKHLWIYKCISKCCLYGYLSCWLWIEKNDWEFQ